MGSQIKVIDTLGNQLHVKTFSGFSLHNLSAFENSFFIYGLDVSNSQIVALQYDYNLQLISQARSNIPNTYIDFAFSKELNISAIATLSHSPDSIPDSTLVLHFCANCEPNIDGYSYTDSNFNCSIDLSEAKNQQRQISLTPGNIFSYTDINGKFQFLQPNNAYALTESLPLYWTHDCGDSITFAIDSAHGNSVGNLFGSVITPGIHDKRINVVPSDFNPGLGSYFIIDYSNVGTEIENGYVRFTLDDSLTFIQSSPPFDSVNGQTYFWNFSTLQLLEHRQIFISSVLSTLDTIGSQIFYSASIEPISGDTTPQNNIDSGSLRVRGSFDPNDKNSKATNKNETGNLTDSSMLTYTIRFQNTGNDTAHKVVVLDSLDTDLDISTLEVIAFSHSYEIALYDNRVLKFTFDNILLPDSGANQLLSNGFIVYTIHPKKNLLPGTQIDNTAVIYFDYNAGVRTNTVSDWIELNPTAIFKIQDKDQLHLFLFPNPSNNIVNVITDESMAGSSLNVYDITGRKMLTAQLTTANTQLATSSFANGVYLVSVENEKGKTTKRLVIQH